MVLVPCTVVVPVPSLDKIAGSDVPSVVVCVMPPVISTSPVDVEVNVRLPAVPPTANEPLTVTSPLELLVSPLLPALALPSPVSMELLNEMP